LSYQQEITGGKLWHALHSCIFYKYNDIDIFSHILYPTNLFVS